MSVAPTHPSDPAKNAEGDFDQFKGFMRKLVSVPHSEIKARIEAEKQQSKKRVSRVPDAS